MNFSLTIFSIVIFIDRHIDSQPLKLDQALNRVSFILVGLVWKDELSPRPVPPKLGVLPLGGS